MDEFNAGSNKNLNIPSFLFLSIGGSAVFNTMDGSIYIYNYIRREFIWTLESTLLFIFIQGTFLLNDHPVKLTHRFDDDSSSINLNSHTTTHRDYQRNNTNELRLRDWDCYKVRLKILFKILI
jgi:hypothetical protein